MMNTMATAIMDISAPIAMAIMVTITGRIGTIGMADDIIPAITATTIIATGTADRRGHLGPTSARGRHHASTTTY